MATRRRLIRISTAFALLGLAGLAVVASWGRGWIATGITAAPNAGRIFRPEDDPPPAASRELGIDEQLRIDVEGTCQRKISLSAWVLEPKTPVLGTVLVLHGVRSDKSWLKGLAAQVALQGYRAVLPDLPGHGRSSGDFLTYGACEASELESLLDELSKRGRVSGRVGVVGLSYGAAVGLQLAGGDPRVRSVVAIAPFSSLRAVVPGYVTHYLPILGQLIPSSFVRQAIDQAGSSVGSIPTPPAPSPPSRARQRKSC